jgi:hypothetical protein
MKKALHSGPAQQSYRAEPRRHIVFAAPAQPGTLVEQARAARAATPQRALAENVGRALRELYAEVLAQPFPPELAALMEGLERGRTDKPPVSRPLWRRAILP